MTEKSKDIRQDEQSLKEYLQGDSALSRAYGAEKKAQAPGHLDKAILSAANEAVRSEQVSKIAYSPFARTWYVPASMAAVLMLCVGLVFTIYKDSGQTLLTAPKSEYDIDAQIAPVESTEKFEEDVSGEKSREVKIMDDAVQSGLRDKDRFKRGAAKEMMSDSPYLPERRDASGRLQSADVKKQKQQNENYLNNKLGEMKLKANEQDVDVGANSAPASRYGKAKESQLRQDGLLQDKLFKKEVLDDDIEFEGAASPALSVGNEIMTAEQWLNQINDLWLSGDHQGAKESLNQFLVVYPDYPIEKINIILDPESDLMDSLK